MDADAKMVFERIDFQGSNLTFWYGPNPIKLIAGTAYLPPENYDVRIKVVDLYENFDELDTYFFASHTPKTRCGN